MKLDIETLISAAEQHGQDSEPDHEVGDLQEFLRAAWSLMSDADVARFSALDAVLHCYEAAICDDVEADHVFTVDELLKAATQHGEDSEPDHEVGDLQEFLRAIWSVLDEPKRQQIFALDAVRETYAGATGDQLPAAAPTAPPKMRMR